MADNSTLPAAGDIVAADEIAGVKFQRIKLIHGADGINAGDVSAANPLPVTVPGLLKAEDDAHSSGDIGLQALAVRKDTAAALAGADGDYHPLLVDSSGRLHVNIGSMPGAARTTDAVAAALQTDAIMVGATALTPKFVSVTVAASSTDSVLVAAVTSKKIRVVSFIVQVGGVATDVTFESGGTTRIHKVAAGANGGQAPGFSPAGHFETAAGASLTATTSAGSSAEITLTYIEV